MAMTNEQMVERLNYLFKDEPQALATWLMMRVPCGNRSLDCVPETRESYMTLVDIIDYLTDRTNGEFIIPDRNASGEAVGFKLTPPGCVRM